MAGKIVTSEEAKKKISESLIMHSESVQVIIASIDADGFAKCSVHGQAFTLMGLAGLIQAAVLKTYENEQRMAREQMNSQL